MQLTWTIQTLAGASVTCFVGRQARQQAAAWLVAHPGHVAVLMVL